MLDQLSPFPASVANARFDLLAYNDVYRRLISDLRRGPARGSQHPVARVHRTRHGGPPLVEWEATMGRMVAQYRLNMADHVGEPSWKDLVRRLSDASPEFVDMWSRRDVQGVENRTKLLMNTHVGLLRLHHTSYWIGPRSGTRVVVYTPLDEEARRRLEKLALVDF